MSVSNSSLEILNFSGERRLDWEWTGKPVVGMRCWTPCLGKEAENVGVVNAGLLRRRDRNLSADARAEMWNDWCRDGEPLIIFKLSVRMSLLFARSTRRLCERRKSPPRMHCVTLATMKRHVYF